MKYRNCSGLEQLRIGQWTGWLFWKMLLRQVMSLEKRELLSLNEKVSASAEARGWHRIKLDLRYFQNSSSPRLALTNGLSRFY